MGILNLFTKSADPNDGDKWFLPPKYARPLYGSRIKMLKTMRGSPDGIQVQEFIAGETYTTTAALAESFIGMGAATKI
jgi:hypothetical protein